MHVWQLDHWLLHWQARHLYGQAASTPHWRRARQGSVVLAASVSHEAHCRLCCAQPGAEPPWQLLTVAAEGLATPHAVQNATVNVS